MKLGERIKIALRDELERPIESGIGKLRYDGTFLTKIQIYNYPIIHHILLDDPFFAKCLTKSFLENEYKIVDISGRKWFIKKTQKGLEHDVFLQTILMVLGVSGENVYKNQIMVVDSNKSSWYNHVIDLEMIASFNDKKKIPPSFHKLSTLQNLGFIEMSTPVFISKSQINNTFDIIDIKKMRHPQKIKYNYSDFLYW